MLFIKKVNSINPDRSTRHGRSWCVLIDKSQHPGHSSGVVVGGFGRQKDAEIAKNWLESLAVDWNAPVDRIHASLRALGLGDSDARDRAAYEQLQW